MLSLLTPTRCRATRDACGRSSTSSAHYRMRAELLGLSGPRACCKLYLSTAQLAPPAGSDLLLILSECIIMICKRIRQAASTAASDCASRRSAELETPRGQLVRW